MKINVKKLLFNILLPVVLGSLVGLLTSSFTNYDEIIQPRFAPPGILFPIVWTILYILMGVSYGILKSNDLVNEEINSVYYIQLAVNSLWSIIFFVLKWRLFAFIWIILLAILIISMIRKFYEHNKIAGLLQIPYLIWTLFATYLNLSIYLLNR